MDHSQRSQAIKAFKRALHDHEAPLDPAKPADKALYVESLHLHRDAGICYDPIDKLAQNIDEADGTRVWLFTGNIGCGKSTELRRLRVELLAAEHSVLLIDAGQYVNINHPIQISDFLVSLVAAIAEAASEAVNDELLAKGYFERLRSYFTKTHIKVDELNIGNDVASLKLALQQDPDIKARLQQALVGHVATLQKDLEDYLATEVFPRLREGNAARKIVILVDSLERLRGTGGDGGQVFSSVLDMFSQYTDLLRVKDAQIVYSVAPYMIKLRQHLAGVFGNASVVHLTSLHIFKQRSRELDTEVGLPGVREIVRRRYPDYARLIPDAALDKVIEYSGGDLRDLFRLLLLVLSVLENAETVDAAVNYAIQQMRRDMTWIPRDQIERLRRISRTKAPAFEDAAERDGLVQDLELKRVLMYRNGDDWIDIHPLLRELVDAPPSEPASTPPGGDATA